MKWTTATIETGELPDGRRFITATQAFERPEIIEFINRYPNYWEYAPNMDAWVSPTIELSSVPRVPSPSKA